ncbi:MAG: hypothetical protein JWR90_2518, partial [Marmoricola sp.]|nr:hypothetical protein [Marmoricola sp.]
MAASRTSTRRRQRSVRVTTSVALLAVATLLVPASLLAGAPLWLAIA